MVLSFASLVISGSSIRRGAGIRAAEAQIGVSLDQLGDPSSVGGGDRLDLELACSDGSEEAGFCCGTELM